MKSIWNSEAMNAMRPKHREGRRRQNGVCFGQLSYYLPDDIDAHRPMLQERLKTLAAPDTHGEPPGGTSRPFAAVAA
jgi:hypothetical protein